MSQVVKNTGKWSPKTSEYFLQMAYGEDGLAKDNRIKKVIVWTAIQMPTHQTAFPKVTYAAQAYGSKKVVMINKRRHVHYVQMN